jgi:PadR family transcriptional regulator AphA
VSLRFAVLGVLSSQAMTGYDMTRYFKESVGTLWPASAAQTYVELRRLEAEGLISGSVAPRGKLAEKRVYELTSAGRQALRLFATEPYGYPAERDGFRLQFVYLDLVPYAIAREHLNAHIAHYRLRIEQLRARIDGIKNRRSALMQARLRGRDPAIHETIVAFRAHALEAQVMTAEAEIAWAKKGLTLVANLEHARPSAKPAKRVPPVKKTARRKTSR